MKTIDYSKFTNAELVTMLTIAKRYKFRQVIIDIVNELSEREWGLAQ